MSFFSGILKKLAGNWSNQTCVSIRIINGFFAIQCQLPGGHDFEPIRNIAFTTYSFLFDDRSLKYIPAKNIWKTPASLNSHFSLVGKKKKIHTRRII